MKNVVLVARVLMGLPLIVFGLNGFFFFLEMPAHEPPAQSFLDALVDSGFVMRWKSGIEIAAGVLLVTGRFVPFALVLFAPILVNIVGFHIYLEPAPDKAALGGALLALELFLAWAYWPHFQGVLSAGARSRYG